MNCSLLHAIIAHETMALVMGNCNFVK